MNIKKMVKFLGISVLLLFLFSYFLETSGYYEYNLQNTKNLTEEQIKQFESDVKAGKDIDLNTYLEKATVDYSSPLTRTTSEASIRLNNYLKNILTNTLSVLGKFIQ